MKRVDRGTAFKMLDTLVTSRYWHEMKMDYQG